MIRRVFSGSFGSANILRQRKWEAQRANQPRAVAPPLRNYPLYQFLIKLGNLIEDECDRCIICVVVARYSQPNFFYLQLFLLTRAQFRLSLYNLNKH